ncbi:hypothetical protein MPSEU_000920300 [Mayamaea pseudoterrestris]|nr:hypothetical protein MPSEU_000920300 [Mayamaea pseudoterrestris]
MMSPFNDVRSNADATSSMINAQKSLHIAPMMDVTTREFRYFMRLLTKHTVLWSEMVVDETIAHSSDRHHHLGFDEAERPIVCQIGGNNPEIAYEATKIVLSEYKYDAIDLNCACPSRKVCAKQAFGAALMLRQDLAVDMIQSMQQAANDCCDDDSMPMPVSIKTRIGVDCQEDLQFLVDYIERLRPHCRRFFIHARKVHTKGLSPAQNRNVPPLNYPRVYAICRHFSDCDFYINGGIQSLQEAHDLCYGAIDALEHDDQLPCLICNHSNGSCVAPLSTDRVPHNLRGAMIGRAARDNPAIMADADRFYFGCHDNPCLNRRQALTQYCEYLEKVHPRRCCDDDAKVTMRMAQTQENVEGNCRLLQQQEYCRICRRVYQSDGSYKGPAYWKGETGKLHVDASADDPACELIVFDTVKPPKMKIAGHIMDRSFKPVLGIFFGKRGCSQFRRQLEDLSKDPWIRNCGPGAVLRIAMNCMDANLLDQDFARTGEEDYLHEKHTGNRHL